MAFPSSKISDRPGRVSDRNSDSIVLGGSVAAAQYEPTAYRATVAAENSRIANDARPHILPLSLQDGDRTVASSKAGPTSGGETAMLPASTGSSTESQTTSSPDQYQQIHAGMTPGVDSYAKVQDGGVSTSERRLAAPQRLDTDQNPHFSLRIQMET